jgi:hypothetical protein
VDQVHWVLGRHRSDDPRSGWISGLDDEDGKKHPTKGGLRIGKKMKERERHQSFDEQMEWDRDGQYFHYLTKWMHALNYSSRVTGDSIYLRWAVELAKTAHTRFTYMLPSTGSSKMMYWKMSIDLSYPLVSSMGYHDPLDGLITYHKLQAAINSQGFEGLDLETEIAELTELCQGRSLVTHDPLGLGELLAGAWMVAQLIADGYFYDLELLETIIDSVCVGIPYYVNKNPSDLPAASRLAFRELGLAVGFQGLKRIQELTKTRRQRFEDSRVTAGTSTLMQYAWLGDDIGQFWLEPENRRVTTWTEHRDINAVMLVTNLIPDGSLRV